MAVKRTIGYVSAAIVIIMMTSCLATKSYKKPEVETQNLYPFNRVQMDSTTLADMPWQQLFNDPQLRSLIKEALKNNLNLQQAIQQIRVAEADFYQGKMSLLPSLGLNAAYSRNETSDNSSNLGGQFSGTKIPAADQYTLSLQSSWELDVWGKLSSVKRASLAALLQSQASRRAVQTTLIADVANAYYTLLGLDKKLKITRQTVKNRKQDVEVVKSLKEGAFVNGVAVQQSIANRYAAEVTIPDLEQQIEEQENALSILLGRSPDAVKRTSLAEQQPIDSLAVGVPAQLLRNRPDILEAEYSFRQAFELTNNARAYFYPSFTLTAEGGFRSLKTENLFDPGSVFYNIVAGLTEPIFNKGQNRARLKRSKAQQQQALLQLRSTILQAGGEVSNTLNRYNEAKRKLSLRENQLDALHKAVDYARELLQYGDANYTDVLTAQQNLLAAQLSSVNDKLQQLTSQVDLYRALGGGWNNNEGVGKKSAPAESASAVEGG